MLATPIEIWLQHPASVLLVAPGDDRSPIPYVRRVSRADYWRACGYQAGYNDRLGNGMVAPVEGLRLNVNASRLLEPAHTWFGASWLLAHPMFALGLVWTQGGSDWVERDMRQLFADRADADKAAAFVVRSLERF